MQPDGPARRDMVGYAPISQSLGRLRALRPRQLSRRGQLAETLSQWRRNQRGWIFGRPDINGAETAATLRRLPQGDTDE